MIGSVIAKKLLQDGFNVKVVEPNMAIITSFKKHDNLTLVNDFGDNYINNISDNSLYGEIIVLAVPGFTGYKHLKLLSTKGAHVVDISFSPEDMSDIKFENSACVYDCGLAPGLPNMILGLHMQKHDVESFEYVVGGMTITPIAPFYYKAPFSVVDVVEEYTRPARFIEDGLEKEISPFDDIITWKTGFDAFPTDGLRSLLKLPVDNIKERTIRHTGHMQFMKNLFDAGFFETSIKSQTEELLKKKWKFEGDEDDFVVFETITTTKSGEKITYKLYDEKQNGVTAMARTTGYTTCAVVNMLHESYNDYKGIMAPEEMINEKNMNYILSYLYNNYIFFDVEELKLEQI